MKRNWLENKANETEEEIQAEVRELAKRSSRNQRMKLESIIVTLRKVEFLRKDNMEEGATFLEEEEELEEVKSNFMLVENQDTSLGNVPREIKKEEVKNKLLKHKSMWKQKQ